MRCGGRVNDRTLPPMTNRTMLLALLGLVASAGCKKKDEPAATPAAGSSAGSTEQAPAVATPGTATPKVVPPDAEVPAPPPASAWETYTSKEGKFSLELPSKPMEKAQGTMTMVMAQFGTTAADPRDATCGAVYMALPPEAKDPKVMFDGATARHKQNAKVIEEKDVKLGKHPGRSLVVENDSHRKWMRIYAANNTLYIVNCGGPFDRAASDGVVATRVLESFKLVQ